MWRGSRSASWRFRPSKGAGPTTWLGADASPQANGILRRERPPKSGRLPRNLSLTKKRNIWGIRRDMPKKEADLTALENEETAAADNRSAETAETPAVEAQGEEATVGRAEFEQLK